MILVGHQRKDFGDFQQKQQAVSKKKGCLVVSLTTKRFSSPAVGATAPRPSAVQSHYFADHPFAAGWPPYPVADRLSTLYCRTNLLFVRPSVTGCPPPVLVWSCSPLWRQATSVYNRYPFLVGSQLPFIFQFWPTLCFKRCAFSARWPPSFVGSLLSEALDRQPPVVAMTGLDSPRRRRIEMSRCRRAIMTCAARFHA